MIENYILEEPPRSYTKINFAPISVDTHRLLSDEPPPTGTQTILAAENLTIEDMGGLIKPDTFSLWKADCHISKDMADALNNVRFAIVHRFSSRTERDGDLEKRSTDLLSMAVACLSLIRPTRRSHAMNVHGVIKADGAFDAHAAHHYPSFSDPSTQKQRKLTRKRESKDLQGKACDDCYPPMSTP